MDGSLVNALISTLMQSMDTIAPLVQWVDISPGLGIHGVGRNLTLLFVDQSNGVVRYFRTMMQIQTNDENQNHAFMRNQLRKSQGFSKLTKPDQLVSFERRKRPCF